MTFRTLLRGLSSGTMLNAMIAPKPPIAAGGVASTMMARQVPRMTRRRPDVSVDAARNARNAFMYATRSAKRPVELVRAKQ